MDTHIAAHPPFEAESDARSPEGARKPPAPDGFPEEDPGPRVRLPGEAAEPLAGKGFEELSGAVAPEAPERLPASTLTPQDPAPGFNRGQGERRLTRRRTLFLGVAVIALAALAVSAYLVSPYNHVYPVPQMASTVRHWTAEAGVTRPEPLAPAASLAGVPTSPAEPVVREKYQPKKKDQQLQELLALHGRAMGAASTDGQPNDGLPPATPAEGKTAAGSGTPAAAPASPVGKAAVHASDGDQPPPGYVPSEPGAHPASPPAASGVPLPPEAAASGAPSPPSSSPPAAPMPPAPGSGPGPASSTKPAGGPRVSARAQGSLKADGAGSDATAAVVASLSKPSEAAPSSPPAAVSASQAEAAAAKPAPDLLELAGELRAAPLAPQDQVQTLELVTQIAAMVRDLRAQDAQLRADFGKAAADNAARLADFERRLALTEARNAVSAARAVGDSAASISPASAGTDPAQPSAPAPPAKTAPVLVTPAAALPPSDQGAAKRYRVQAASPGLALLAEFDRGGGEGAQLEVLVGDKIPGYGKVTSIGQRGTAWVVATEHGNIQ